MAETNKKINRSFWIVFAVLIFLAVIATIGNIIEYWNMNKLDTEGKRILCPVDSVVKAGSKEEVFTHFSLNGKVYNASKKLKSPKVQGDTVSVYYLEKDPSMNRIEGE